VPRTLKLTRELVDRLPARVDERGPVRWSVDDSYYPATAAKILSALPEDGALWVFAIGSLIWKQRFPAIETRPALIRGWHRSFCLGPDMRFRGNPAAPGLMMSLDRGGQCRGVAFRMDPVNLTASLEELLRSEPPTPPRWVRAATGQGMVKAIAFTIDRGHFMHVAGLSEAEVADRLSKAVGHVGSMPDYLLNTVAHLEELGYHDRYLWRMQALVAGRLEKLPDLNVRPQAPKSDIHSRTQPLTREIKPATASK
jgi:glutathione-specific gamma-glutamylcyclotransferase